MGSKVIDCYGWRG